MNRMDSRERHKLRLYRAEAYVSQNGKCYWCGSHVPRTAATADHIEEWAKGFRTTRDNVVMSCQTCNNDRSNRRQHDEHVYMWIKVTMEKKGIFLP